jgi:uncharacterized membrane protein
MATKIILLFTLLAYSMIVSQSFMYILSLKDVQINLDVNAYTQVRKLIDASMRSNFKYVIYAALLGNLLLLVLTLKNPGSVLFVAATIAFVALVVDTLLTVKGNLPINNIINTWEPSSVPADWADYRTKWLTIFQYRQVANIIGFLSLLVGTVFGAK